MVQDGQFTVPKVLKELKNLFFKYNGLTQEGVFRVPAEENQMKRDREFIIKGNYSEVKDIHCISNLIKVFYRELPHGILNLIPNEVFDKCEDERACARGYNALPHSQKQLFTWLLDLLVEVAKNEASNKMTIRALAIVVAPNLLRIDIEKPMESLAITQKSVTFLLNILTLYKNMCPELVK